MLRRKKSQRFLVKIIGQKQCMAGLIKQGFLFSLKTRYEWFLKRLFSATAEDISNMTGHSNFGHIDICKHSNSGHVDVSGKLNSGH